MNKVCEQCPSSYFCARLHEARVIAETELAQAPADEQGDSLLAVMRAVEESKWAYPDGEQRCALATRPERVRHLTDMMIGWLDGRRKGRLRA